ncbi:MAG: hypothetical protein ACK5Q5_21125 [Planctomycetaceae bacterium]
MILHAGIVTALLVLASVPLIIQRKYPPEEPSIGAVVWILIVPLLWLVWSLVVKARIGSAAKCTSTSSDETNAVQPLSWKRELLIIGLLGALTYVAYYTPMWRSYWRGADDAGLFWTGEHNPIWEIGFDRAAGRPLQMAGMPALSRALKPNYRDGYLWVTGTLWFLNAWLLYLIVRRILPENRFVAVAASILLITSSSEPSRFFVFSTGQTYSSSLCVLLLSFWLLLIAVDRRSVGWLMAACLVLGATLLSNEGQFPLALMGFVLIGATFKDRRSAIVAAYAWFGVLFMLSTRLIIFLVQAGDKAYQLRQAGAAKHSLRELVVNARRQLFAIKDYFGFRDLSEFPHYGSALLGLLCVLGLFWVIRTDSRRTEKRRLRWLLVWAAAALLLGVAPFVHIPIVFRTQYFAIPGQALLLAALLSLVSTFLLPRRPQLMASALLGLLAFNGILDAHRLQDSQLNRPNFDRLAHVFQQIRSLAPRLGPEQLVVLVPADMATTPLGGNLALAMMSEHLLQTAVVQLKDLDGGEKSVLLHSDRVSVHGTPQRVCHVLRSAKDLSAPCEYDYANVLVFGMTGEGNLQLMDSIAPELVLGRATPVGYVPRSWITSQVPEPVRFCQYESNTIRPKDVLPHSQGFCLDGDWSALCRDGDEVHRSGSSDADIYINMQSAASRSLTIRAAAGPAMQGEPILCRVMTDSDEVLTEVTLAEPKEIALTIPARGELGRSIRFVPVNQDQRDILTGRPFVRLLLQQELTDPLQIAMLQPGARAKLEAPQDINDYTVDLGENWLRLVTTRGPAFRWVENNAEVLVPRGEQDFGVLEMDVERGPGYGPGPLELKLIDETGAVAGITRIKSREVVRFAMTNRRLGGTRFRLSCNSQGLKGPGELRVLNFRAFSLRYSSLDASEYEFLQAQLKAPPSPPNDVHDGSVILAGQWYPLARSKQGPFRWVNNDAEVIVQTSEDEPTELILDAEIGPSCGKIPGHVQVLNADDDEVAAFDLGTRKNMKVTLPASDGGLKTYRLRIDSEAKPVAGDTRVLNLRVFGVRTGSAEAVSNNRQRVQTASFEQDAPAPKPSQVR